jgi:hypothetical protein
MDRLGMPTLAGDMRLEAELLEADAQSRPSEPARKRARRGGGGSQTSRTSAPPAVDSTRPAQ